MRSWKTTFMGIAALVAVAAKIVTTGQFDWTMDGPAILAGLGLITAKDHDITGVGADARRK